MTYRRLALLLAILSIGSLAMFGYVLHDTGMAHLGWLGAGLSFLGMVIALPFLAGFRLKRGHVAKPLMCRECHAVQRHDDRRAGFCLRCGGRRVVTYERPM